MSSFPDDHQVKISRQVMRNKLFVQEKSRLIMSLYSDSKKENRPVPSPLPVQKYTWLVAFCFLATGWQSLHSQTPVPDLSVKIEYTSRQVTATALFDELQQQSGYGFLFDRALFDEVSLSNLRYKSIPLQSVLSSLSKSHGFLFSVAGKNIAVKTDQKVYLNTRVDAPSGILKGRIVEFESSLPLAGASVTVVELKKNTVSDGQGYYQFPNLRPGKYTLQVSYVGFTTEKIQIDVKSGRTETYDVKLQGSNTLREVTVSRIAKTRRPVAHTTDRQLLQEIKASQLTVSGISSQQISISADRNVAEVVKKISGITTKDDKFIIIRGMNERYNLTYLNGVIAPSTELYSRAFSLDLIPSRIIDKILVFKSPTPELPADMTGGAVKIFTKDARLVRHLDIELQTGYRPGTTFNQSFLTYQGSRTDFLGFDNGVRKLPSTVPGYGNFNQSNLSQTEYLKSFSPVLSLKEKTAAPNVQLIVNYYNTFKLGSRYLGSLTSFGYKNESQKNMLYQQQGSTFIGAHIDTKSSYPGKVSYANQNTNVAQFNLIQNFTMKVGDSTILQWRNFLLQQGQNLTSLVQSGGNAFDSLKNYFPAGKLSRNLNMIYSQRFLYSTGLGGSHHFKGSNPQSLDWNLGFTSSTQTEPDNRTIRLRNTANWSINALGFETVGDSTLGWAAIGRSYASGNEQSIRNGIISRTWTKNSESVFTGVLDYNFTPHNPDWLNVKAGLFQLWKARSVYRRVYLINEGDLKGIGLDVATAAGGYGDYVNTNLTRFRESNLPDLWSDTYFRDDGSGLKVYDRTRGSDAYNATEQNSSGYLAASLRPFGKALDIYGGLRVEYSRIKVAGSIVNIDETGSQTYLNIPVLSDLNRLSLLPSVNITYRPAAPWVLRLGYGKTVNRPEFREISPFNNYDFVNNSVITGNPKLVSADVNNYNGRIEWYNPKKNSADAISIGAFYKTLENPIERISFLPTLNDFNIANISFENADKASVKGLEIDMRKSLDFIPGKIFRDLAIIGNATLISSEVTKLRDSANATSIYDQFGSTHRPLQGQVPYVVNAGIFYQNAGSGTQASLNFYRSGLNIYAVSVGGKQFNGSADAGSMLELPGSQLDLSITQRIVKSLQCKIIVQNLLDKDIMMAEDLNQDYKYEQEDFKLSGTTEYPGDNLAYKLHPGRYFVFSLNYSF